MQAERTVDEIVVVADVASLAGNLVALCYTVEAAVLQVHVIDVADGIEGNDQHAVL